MSRCSFVSLLLRTSLLSAVALAAVLAGAQGKPKPNAAPDVLVLSNGDTLHGKFVSAINGTVTFHSEALGDVKLGWDKVKELHTAETFAVIDKSVHLRDKKNLEHVPMGTIAVDGESLKVEATSSVGAKSVPVKNVPYILDQTTLKNEVAREPGFFDGWGGAATAGATLVTATQNQYTFTGGIALARTVPMVDWLDRRNRMSADFTGSFGKITQPGYYDATNTYVPGITTKSAIYHAGAERDEYFSPRLYVLGQVAFDHNYGQSLDLQQIYGGGFGWTFLKTAQQEGDLKGTAQYEKQQFMSDSSQNQNLVGSTFSGIYVAHLKMLTFVQNVAYIPAYNNMRAYSATESNTISFPFYKNLGFSLGTMDSYLNDPPVSYPPTKRNSFQFTMGMTYTIPRRR